VDEWSVEMDVPGCVPGWNDPTQKTAKKKPDHTDAVLIKRMDERQDADRMKTILTPG
jgi:hypothetical protein